MEPSHLFIRRFLTRWSKHSPLEEALDSKVLDRTMSRLKRGGVGILQRCLGGYVQVNAHIKQQII